MSYAVPLPAQDQYEAWRQAARLAISHRLPPEALLWQEPGGDGPGLFAPAPLPSEHGPHQVNVTQAFLKLAQSVIWHKAPERFSLLYQALWRLDQKAGDPLSQADALGRRLQLMAKSVGRDIHKMHAFLRFRELPAENEGLPLGDLAQDPPRRRFAAWFEPEHNILEPASRFFVKRFADMDWMIATPRQTAHFKSGKISFHAAAPRPDLPEDASESLWATYFANIFNPARVKLQMMRSEMPKKYWKNLPETRLIPALLKDAEARVARMHAAATTSPSPGAARIATRYRDSMPKAPLAPNSLEELAAAAALCQNCPLSQCASQTVCGEGDRTARLMLVGEQPGDREDLAGRPFIGPAGQLLREIITEAGGAPEKLWLTNAVKHFKFRAEVKLRRHLNPNHNEISACRPWLIREIDLIKPRLILALGATAALSLTGDSSALRERRGQITMGRDGVPVLVTLHPSHILRLPDPERKAEARQFLQADLRLALKLSEAETIPCG